MSSPPGQQPPPAFTPLNASTGGDRDAPMKGRLARADVTSAPVPTNLTRGGNTRTKFQPKLVTRKSAQDETAAPQKDATPKELATPGSYGTRGRGRGRGRGETATRSSISGPFAAGPAGIGKPSTRQSRSRVDSSVTVEDAPPENSGPVEPNPNAPSSVPIVKKEGLTRKKPTSTPRKTKVKKEEDNGYEEIDENYQMAIDDRVDLAELNFPGGPVCSRRKSDRVGRGWKKIELWIEQEDAEEIVLDDTPEPEISPPRQVTVKVEDEPMGEINLPEPEPMMIEPDGDQEEIIRLAARNRSKRLREVSKGKSQEEKEEMAREEVDLDVLKNQFLAVDGSEREQKMLLVQLPLTLPPLRSVDGTVVKTEVKSEDSASNIPQPSTALPSGKIGQLRVHASGKTVLSYGGIDFTIRLASDVGFAQDFVVMDPIGQKKAWRLGNVGAGQEGGWLIGVPDLRGMHRK